MIWIILGIVVVAAGGLYLRKRHLDKKYGRKRVVVLQSTDKNGNVQKSKVTERVKDEDRGYSDEDVKKARKIVKESIAAGELKIESTLEEMVDAAEELDPSLGEKNKPSAQRPSFKKSSKKKSTKNTTRRMPSTKSTKKANKKKTTKKKPSEDS